MDGSSFKKHEHVVECEAYGQMRGQGSSGFKRKMNDNTPLSLSEMRGGVLRY